MRSEQEIQDALASHSLNLLSLVGSKAFLKKVARDLGWTEERVKGYTEGVIWAYTWILEIDQK